MQDQAGPDEITPSACQITPSACHIMTTGSEVAPDAIHALFVEAQGLCATAVRQQEEEEAEVCRQMGVRLRAEQDRMLELILANVPAAVREAASKGHRVATLLAFAGADKLDEFSYLYMLKGPHKHEQRQEMRAMGARPLIYRVRDALRPFAVHHAWQRATNENTLSVSW